jgi:hypothetical protein
MIITEFNLFGVSVSPCETDSPLPADADRILPGPIFPQSFEVIGRRHAEIIDGPGLVDHQELVLSAVQKIGGRSLDKAALEQRGRAPVAKTLDHRPNNNATR